MTEKDYPKRNREGTILGNGTSQVMSEGHLVTHEHGEVEETTQQYCSEEW